MNERRLRGLKSVLREIPAIVHLMLSLQKLFHQRKKYQDFVQQLRQSAYEAALDTFDKTIGGRPGGSF